jgi:hypothetical protein
MRNTTRRTALGLGLAGSTACAAVAQQIAARLEGAGESRFIDPKRGAIGTVSHLRRA